MKKLTVVLAMAAVFACGSSAWATLYTVNSDGPQALAANTAVTNQYSAADGINLYSGTLATQYSNLTGVPAASVLGATSGTPTGWVDQESGKATTYIITPANNFLGFNKTAGTGDSGAAFQFSSLVNSLQFDYTRPGTQTTATTNITVLLYNTLTGNAPVDTINLIAKTTSVQNENYDTGTAFNLAVIEGGANRFMLDNLSYNTVGATPTPIPAAFLLFGSGLSGLFCFKRKLTAA